MKNLFKTSKILKSIFLSSLTILISVLIVFTVTNAGSLSPTASPASTFYTLADIYTRLTTNATATEANHDLSISNSPSATFYTLKQIYDAIPTIDATKVSVGTTYLGVTGTLLANMWNGTGFGYTGGSQTDGGIDDYNNGGSPSVGRYAGTWTQCIVDNNYCNTGDSGSAYKDNSTGLVWSKTMNSSNYALDDSTGSITWFVANNCTEISGSTCTKKTSSKTGCEANTGWSLPNQKQLMMAYINGSYGNVDASGVGNAYWSSSTVAYTNTATSAWYTGFSGGYTAWYSKTLSLNVRCVRTAP